MRLLNKFVLCIIIGASLFAFISCTTIEKPIQSEQLLPDITGEEKPDSLSAENFPQNEQTPPEISIPTDILSTQSNSRYTTGEMSLKYADPSYYEYYEGNLNYVDIHIYFPIISAPYDINIRINQQIFDYVCSIRGDYFEKYKLAANDTFYVKTEYDVTFFGEKYVSIHFISSIIPGGSPAYASDDTLTFNLETGEKVSLFDFYSIDQVMDLIDTYFDEHDVSEDKTIYLLCTKEELKEDFKNCFNPESNYYNPYSYYLSENKLYLIAGFYDVDNISPNNALRQGRGSFIAEIDVGNPPWIIS